MRIFLPAIFLPCFLAPTLRAQDDDLADALREFDSRVIVVGKVRENPLASMLARDARADLRAANLRDAKAWEPVKTKADWEAFRDSRLQALRASLGTFPPPPKDLKVRVTRTHRGDGYAVDNIVFESRPGVLVTANLYRPTKAAESMPGMILVHSHHRPKHVGQRQDMAMTWARAGCLVLIPDLLGHGERALHPFQNADAYDQPFKVEMQDYWFRYDLGMQLHLIGDSLMGWMAYDLSRGVDVLLGHKGVDPKRIIIVSEPAGGGDVAAVTMALDLRITAGVINNFGGPQPESPYPLPRDADQAFDFAGGGSWESTRNLRLSARDGFLPWMIVASAAPRKLVYLHEFYWDKGNDPVWKRLQKVWSLYDAADSLAGFAGRGFVVGSAPENTHWLPSNRELLYPTFKRWFDIPDPKAEYSLRRPESELLCLTPELVREMRQQPVHELIAKLGEDRAREARAKLQNLKSVEAQQQVRTDWVTLLGNIEPAMPRRIDFDLEDALIEKVRVERHHLSVEPGIVVPLVVLIPPHAKKGKLPLVVGVAQGGKQEFFLKRFEVLAALLREGIAVALPDVRGTGETSPGSGRDRRSTATALSATAFMTGETLLGARLRDLRSTLRFLKQHPDIDAKRIALWGDSFAPPNSADDVLRIPHGVDRRPDACEPLGGMLALLGALYEADIRAVYVYGGLSSYATALASPFCYVPHDAIVPGVLTTGNLCDLAAALSPRPLRLSALVDGSNRTLARSALEKTYQPTRSAYRAGNVEESFVLEPDAPTTNQLTRWFATHLRAK
jgi:cephalosporin-C deacetylase-like acetyl esterase